MSGETIESYEQVIESVRSFNEGLEQGEDLETLLSYFRAWYYIPELDAVGPSKFIGYKDMTASKYMNRNDLDGKVTEPVLSRWFDILDEDSPEAKYVADLTDRLFSRYKKAPNRVARYCAPRLWNLQDPSYPQSRPLTVHTEDHTEEVRPIVEVFWRAYLSLYPEDQVALASRIIKHRSS